MFFTDKMPKSCLNCPCASSEWNTCNIDYNVKLDRNNRPKECPLQEVKHAHWVITEYEYLDCSHCGKAYYTGADSHREAKEWLEKGHAYSYCPYCGAKMDEE